MQEKFPIVCNNGHCQTVETTGIRHGKPYCKICNRIKAREYSNNHKEQISIKRKYKYANDIIYAQAAKDRANRRRIGPKREEILIKKREWSKLTYPDRKSYFSSPEYKAHKSEYDYKYISTRLKTDPKYALAYRLRALIRNALIYKGIKKTTKTYKLLGCTPVEFYKYIESKFLEGMTWENRNLWHLDHIKPCAAFDNLADLEQQKQCFHYTNLQPLWKFDNISKGAKYQGIDYKSKKNLRG